MKNVWNEEKLNESAYSFENWNRREGKLVMPRHKIERDWRNKEFNMMTERSKPQEIVLVDA
jgi:hypothetical protein